MQQSTWYDVKTAADYLGLSESGLRKLLAKHRIAYRQDGKHSPIKIKSEWLDQYIEQHTIRPDDPEKPTMGNGRPKRATRAVGDGSDNAHGFNWDLLSH